MNLDPVREALLAQARADADALLAQADREAAAALATARATSGALVEQARAEGAAAAELAGTHDQAQARSDARALVLAAEREVYEELCATANERVRSLRGTEAHRAVLARLEALARSQLGADASVESGDEGVQGRSNGRSVDYSLETVVARAIESLGARTETLWQ